MAFAPTDTLVGARPITTADDVQQHAIGTTITAFDPTYGTGRFEYHQNLTGGALAAGDVVTIDDRAANSASASVVAASRGAVGVAMAALGVNQFGWFQVEGAAVVKAAVAAAAAPAYLNAAAGSIISTAAIGQKVDGAVFKTANGTPSAGFAVCELNFPSANGNG